MSTTAAPLKPTAPGVLVAPLTFDVSNHAVIPAFNALANLGPWLRPGRFAFMVAEHMEAMRAAAVRLSTTREALLDEAGLRHAPTLAGTDTPNPLAGQYVKSVNPQGLEIVMYKSNEAGAEFRRREAELFDAKTSLTVNDRFTPAMFLAKIDGERLPEPKDAAQGGATVAVDFVALMPLFYRPEFTRDGVDERVAVTTSSEG